MPVRLTKGQADALVFPQAGGALGGFWWQTGVGRVDWLRPTPPGAEVEGEPTRLSCFPMVPFFGRIKDGRFVFAGRAVSLPFNRPGIAHAVHGHGWQHAWEIESRSEAEITLAYCYRPGDWPWPYRARQRVALGEDGSLTLALAVENMGDEPMPAGLGFHPYFPRGADAVITARLPRIWQSDDQLMPLDCRPVPVDLAFDAGRLVDDLDLDHVFAGWNGQADLVWRDRGLRLTADPVTDLAVIVARPGRDFFTFEPVTQTSDAFNRLAAGAADSGTAILGRGERITLAMRLAPYVIS